MTLLAPTWLENLTYEASDDRALIDALFASQGVLGSGDLKVSQRAAGANRSVDVAVGRDIIIGTLVSLQRKYLCESTGVVNVPLDAAPGTGQSRIDAIIGQVRDDDADSGGNNDWIITFVKGAASSSTPTPPTLPATCDLYGYVLVGANVTSIVNANITDKRTRASLLQAPTATARLYQPSNQSPILDVTWTQVTGLATDFATGITVGSDSFTIVTPGVYRLTAVTHLIDMNAAGNTIENAVYINGTRALGGWCPADGGLQGMPVASGIKRLAVNDVIKSYVFGSGVGGFGGSTQGGIADTYLDAELISVN